MFQLYMAVQWLLYSKSTKSCLLTFRFALLQEKASFSSYDKIKNYTHLNCAFEVPMFASEETVLIAGLSPIS